MPAIRSQAALGPETVRCFCYRRTPLPELVIFLEPVPPTNKPNNDDNLKRLVTVSPPRVFIGEQMKYPVKITFVAPGPMHKGNLKVTIPAGLLPAGFSLSMIVMFNANVHYLITLALGLSRQ